MWNELHVLLPIFFTIAIVYSAAGFGGGSSYLAVLTLFLSDHIDLRMIALICNITVVTGSLFIFWKADLLRVRKAFSLIILSIPFAYLGGTISLEQKSFFIILAISLLISGLLMIFPIKQNRVSLPNFANPIVGGGIGLLSGMIGIGGGIFLSPILHLTNWSKAKIIASTTALFILVNSLAGLLGQLATNDFNWDWRPLLFLVISVALGSQIGSRLTVLRFDPITIRRLSATLIIVIAIRLLYQYL